MPFTRADLYRQVADFLNEREIVPDATHFMARRVEENELIAAEQALSMHPWNFASETKALALVATADPDDPGSDPIGWSYAYNKGSILRVNWVSQTGKERDRITRPGYWVDQGGRILSTLTPLYLNGVQSRFAQQQNYGYWPRPFGTAVASIIGDWLTGPVTNSRGKQSDMSARSMALIEDAHTWDAQQSPGPPRREGRWNSARYGRRSGSGEL